MSVVEQEITVDAPVDRAFAIWTDYESFPTFMEHVKEVRRTAPDMTHWTVETAGKTVEWDARITTERNRRVAWQATGESGQSGEVDFSPAGAGKTRVHVKFAYRLPNKLEEKAASILQLDDHAVRDDLKSFKDLVEQGV